MKRVMRTNHSSQKSRASGAFMDKRQQKSLQLAQVLHKAVKRLVRKGGQREGRELMARLCLDWPFIVGREVASFTRPLKKDGRGGLVLQVWSPAILDMQQKTLEILAGIERSMGEVFTSIKWAGTHTPIETWSMAAFDGSEGGTVSDSQPKLEEELQRETPPVSLDDALANLEKSIAQKEYS